MDHEAVIRAALLIGIDMEKFEGEVLFNLHALRSSARFWPFFRGCFGG